MSLPLRLVLAAAICAATVAGCGSSGDSDESGGEPTARATTPNAPPGAGARVCKGTIAGAEQVRVTGIDCRGGREVAAAWAEKPACAPTSEESRFSCSVGGGFRCLGASVEQGVAVSCSAPGRSVSFLTRRG